MPRQPTENQKVVFSRVVEKVKKGEKVSITKEMRESGVYSEATSKHPEKITQSDGWQTLVDTYLPDTLLSQVHHDLLKSTTLEHMTFPLGVKTDVEKEELYENNRLKADEAGKEYKHIEIVSDEEIIELLQTVNCTVKKIVHSEHCRFVYFWSADNRARKDGLDMAYKLGGKYAPEKRLIVVAKIDPKKKAKINRILGITK